jgi:hypothetical protein
MKYGTEVILINKGTFATSEDHEKVMDEIRQAISKVT